MRVDCRVGVRPIPRQHLDGVTAHGADLGNAPVFDHTRLAAAGGFLDPMLFQCHDQSATRRHQIDRRRHRKVRIEQHRTAMWRERLDQQPLGGRNIGVGDLVSGYLPGLRDRIEHRRPLIERHHAEMTVRIRQSCQAACFSDRSHGLFL